MGFWSREIKSACLRKDALNRLHEGHFGIVKCTELARDAIYWSDMYQEIKEWISKCELCQALMSGTPPDKPWDSVATDVYRWNSTDYFIIVDYYSRIIEVSKFDDTTSKIVMDHKRFILKPSRVQEFTHRQHWIPI